MPRSLNDAHGWADSSLSHTSCPRWRDRGVDRISGVTWCSMAPQGVVAVGVVAVGVVVVVVVVVGDGEGVEVTTRKPEYGNRSRDFGSAGPHIPEIVPSRYSASSQRSTSRMSVARLWNRTGSSDSTRWTRWGPETPTALRTWVDLLFGSNFGWTLPSSTSAGPDWVAKRTGPPGAYAVLSTTWAPSLSR